MNKLGESLQTLKYAFMRLGEAITAAYEASVFLVKYYRNLAKPMPLLHNGRKPTARRRR